MKIISEINDIKMLDNMLEVDEIIIPTVYSILRELDEIH